MQTEVTHVNGRYSQNTGLLLGSPTHTCSYLEQRRLRQDAGEGVQLRHELSELAHRQLVGGLASTGAGPAETGLGKLRQPARRGPGRRDGGRHARPRLGQSHTPGLPLPVEQLLGHRGALLCVLCDEAKVTQKIVVWEFLHLRFFD